MSARDDKIRQVAAELDAHFAAVQASVAILKALLADVEITAGWVHWCVRAEAGRRW